MASLIINVLTIILIRLSIRPLTPIKFVCPILKNITFIRYFFYFKLGVSIVRLMNMHLMQKIELVAVTLASGYLCISPSFFKNTEMKYYHTLHLTAGLDGKF